MTFRHRVHKVIYVPLDDRACNIKHVRLLAQMVDYDLVMPPIDLLGCFTRPGQPEHIWEWLLAEAQVGADAVILSLDMLVYGGLVASRSPETRSQLALQRLDLIHELHKTTSETPILASNLVMRLSTTAPNDQALQPWSLLKRYSELVGLLEEFGKVGHQRELEQIKRRIPVDIAGQYLACRERNHQVNCRAITEVAAGNISFLALTQEDATPFGLHVTEHRKLYDLIESEKLGEKVVLYPGCDQTGAALFTRFVHQHMQKVPRIFVLPSNAGHMKNVAPSEDRPFIQTIESHLRVIGAEPAPGPDYADLVLAVNAPLRRDKAYYIAAPNRLAREQRVMHFTRRIAELAHPGLAVCDAAHLGGAEDSFVSALTQEGIAPLDLLSFAARGTAGDTVSSAITHGTLRLIALQDKGAFDLANVVVSLSPLRYLELLNSLIDSEKAHVSLLFHHFVDDWLYQSRVRPDVTANIISVIETSLFDLTHSYEFAEDLVREELTRAAADLWIERFLGQASVSIGSAESCNWLILAELEETRVRLPWRRLAEVDLDMEFGVELIAGGPEKYPATQRHESPKEALSVESTKRRSPRARQ